MQSGLPCLMFSVCSFIGLLSHVSDPLFQPWRCLTLPTRRHAHVRPVSVPHYADEPSRAILHTSSSGYGKRGGWAAHGGAAPQIDGYTITMGLVTSHGWRCVAAARPYAQWARLRLVGGDLSQQHIHTRNGLGYVSKFSVHRHK